MTKNVDNYCSFLVKFLYAGHKVGLVFSETKKPILKSTVFRLCSLYTVAACLDKNKIRQKLRNLKVQLE